MIVFMPEGTVVATGGQFVKMFGIFVDNTCQALLADQLGSSGMAAGFCKLPTKDTTKNLRNHQICIKMQKYRDFINFIFS